MNITVRNLKKAFKGHQILDGVSFSLQKGEVLGILAPDGSGKTTIMQSLTAFLTPDDGEILYDGVPLQDETERIKGKIGYLAERNPLYESMTVAEFLTYMAHLSNVAKYILPTRIMDVMRTCGLFEERDMLIRKLSKGAKRRIGIAQALVNDPKVLLLDEPTDGLDPNQSNEIRRLIKEISTGRSAIVASHLLQDVGETCGRIIIMHHGRVVADGTAEELQGDKENGKMVKVRLAPISLTTALKAIRELEGVEYAEIEQESITIRCKNSVKIERLIFQLCEEHKWYIKNISTVELSLEEIFRSLTQN